MAFSRCPRRCSRTHSSRTLPRRIFLRYPERLEDRRLLSLAVADYDQPTPAWFEAVELPYGPLTVEQSVVAVASSPDVLSADGTGLARDRWIVQLRDEALAGIETVADVAQRLSVDDSRFAVIRGLGTPGQVLVCSLTGTAEEAATALSANPDVAFVEADRVVQASTVPDDVRFVDEWGLSNTGQFGGTVGVDIDAPQAWDVTTGSTQVVVGVIDSGIDPTHVDLHQNIWLNQGEIPPAMRSQLVDIDDDDVITFRDLNDQDNNGLAIDANRNEIIDALDLFDDPRWGDGIDTDRNGFPDDLFGWDFRHHTPFASDDFGHGTHVAGTIGATGNNGIGVAGVNWAVLLMSLKFLGANNEGTLADAVAAVHYATMMRAEVDQPTNLRVLNASWGQAGDSPALESAIEHAGEAEILFVAAAGNGNVLGEGMDIDQSPFYPASYDLPNIISVAAFGQFGELAGFSNYGVTSVDLAAPGVGILSTKPDGAYALQNGTSMAAPHVTGVAALAWSQVPDATVAEVREALLQNVDQDVALADKLASGGRLNAYHTVTADTFAPRAAIVSMPDITTASATPQRITVRYWSNSPLDLTSLGQGDVVAMRNWGNEDDMLVASVVPDGVTVISPVECTVEYDLAAPGGDWDVWDYGDYEVRVVAGQVQNSAWLASPERELGAFHVQIEAPNVFYVDSLLDTVDANLGDGLAKDAAGFTTLRAAVMEANVFAGPQTIVLQAGTHSLSITGASDDACQTGDLDIVGETTIFGAGADQTILDASALDRMFDVLASRVFQLTGVTVRNGNSAAEGGAIRSFGNTTVTDCQVTGNTGGSGGAIYNGAQLHIVGTTIDHNVSNYRGGGIRSESAQLWIDRSSITANVSSSAGGIWIRYNLATITNSTIAGNRAESFDMASGGGIQVVGSTVTITNTTISGNRAASRFGGGNGGGISGNSGVSLFNCTITNNSAGTGGGVSGGGTLQNTIVADNFAGENVDVSGGFVSLGSNLIGAVGSATGFTAPGDQIVANAADFLGPLQDNGGPTPTHALLPGSTAIDGGTNDGAPATDQRGVSRPYDADQDGQAIVDIGAFERYHVEIHGVRFHDVNGNRDLDAGEPRLGGLTVYLDMNDNGALDAGEPSTVTASDDPLTVDVNETGVYCFVGLEPGVYRVAEVVQPGWKQTLAGFGGIRRISVDADGNQVSVQSGGTSIGGDGQFVAFASGANNLVPGDTNEAVDLFVMDRATKTTERVSVASDGTQANPFNGYYQLYVYDRDTQLLHFVGEKADGTWLGGIDFQCLMVANGTYVIFACETDDFGEPIGIRRLYRSDWQVNDFQMVTLPAGSECQRDVTFSASADGRYMAVQYYNSAFHGTDFTNWDRFVYDFQDNSLE